MELGIGPGFVGGACVRDPFHPIAQFQLAAKEESSSLSDTGLQSGTVLGGLQWSGSVAFDPDSAYFVSLSSDGV